jgi:3-hydroxyisobutyrate dehydrogenase
MTESVGFIGIGNMGGAIATRLLERGPLGVWDMDVGAVQALTQTGAATAESAAALAADCDILLTCLPESKHVRELLFGEQAVAAAMARGTLVADMTTGDPVISREIASSLLDLNIHFVDAPVSGGPMGAQQGTLAIMMGGEADAVARLRPVFEAIFPNLDHVGPVGAGHAMKLANNLLNAICRLATAETVALAAKNGIDPAQAVDIMNRSSGRNYSTDITYPRDILPGTMGQGFTVGLMHKDVRTACELAGATDVPRAFGEIARKLLADGEARFGFDADVNSTIIGMEEAAGVKIKGTAK